MNLLGYVIRHEKKGEETKISMKGHYGGLIKKQSYHVNSNEAECEDEIYFNHIGYSTMYLLF